MARRSGPAARSRRARWRAKGLSGGGYHPSLRGFFTALRDAGARYVLVTDGDAGSFLAEGRAPDDAMRAAALNSASVVGHIDTRSGLLTRTALDAALGEAGNKLEIGHWKF